MYTTEERVEMLEALRIVDKVLVYETVSPEFFEKVDFDILALGEDHRGDALMMSSNGVLRMRKRLFD